MMARLSDEMMKVPAVLHHDSRKAKKQFHFVRLDILHCSRLGRRTLRVYRVGTEREEDESGGGGFQANFHFAKLVEDANC